MSGTKTAELYRMVMEDHRNRPVNSPAISCAHPQS